ncbi:MAG: TorF family putative porin [Thiohalomonadaceae bacterium]
MNIMAKHVLAASVVAAGMLGSPAALAEFSANVGVVSNYVWRGQSQTDDGAALQGGVDYTHDSGAYAGVWASNVDDGQESGIEYDVYVGFANEVGDFGYDVAYLTYNYTNEDFAEDSAEYKLGASYGPLSAAYYLDSDSDYSYVEAGAAFALPAGFGLDLHYGLLDPDEGETAWDYAVGISKSLGGVGLSVSYVEHEEEDDSIVVFGVTSDLSL